MEVAYARILSVSVDPPEVAAAFRAGIGARRTFLADPDRSVHAEPGLRETTDAVHGGQASATDAHQQGAVPRDRHLSG
jgi:peroxiredoxin